jgi:DNA-binding response OmpR family regulator
LLVGLRTLRRCLINGHRAAAKICPHCGGHIDPGAPEPLQHDVFDDARRCLIVGREVRIATPMEWRILRLLRERFGRRVPTEFLISESSSRPHDGGNENSFRAQLCHLRQHLRGSPFSIVNFYGEGYGLFPYS